MSDSTPRTSPLWSVLVQNLASFEWKALLNLRMAGFALNRAWVYLMFLGAGACAVTWNGAATPQMAFHISTIVLFASMIVPALFSRQFEQVMTGPAARALSPALLSLGTLTLASSTLEGAPQMALCVLGGVMTGLGSAVIDLGYGELYRNVSPRHTCVEAPLAFLLAAALYVASRSLPSAAICVVAAAIPLASGCILFLYFRTWAPDNRPAVEPESMALAPFALRIGVCSVLVGSADGLVRAVFMHAGNASPVDFYGASLLWAAIVTIVVIWACVFLTSEFDMVGTYKIAVLIMAFFFQLLPILVGTTTQNVLALAGYGTFNVLIWILLASLASRYRLSSVQVFGIGWSMVTLGVFIGSWLGSAVCQAVGTFAPQGLSAVALSATVAVLLSYMFILKDSDVERLTSDDRGVAGEPDAGADTGPLARGEEKPKFVDRCRELAKSFGLTPRETQVMILYARGRSYNRIQEELELSRSTITTHLTHIYQKMNVHNKQEFLDLIEGRTGV